MKFTVITATCNSEKTIEKTVRSVILQKRAGVDIEHIIIDNCSSDRTLDIVRSCESPFVRIISEPDKGIYDAFNKGINCSSGDVISFLSSDDYYLDGALEKVAGVFKKYDDVVCVHGNIQVGSRVCTPVNGFLSFNGKRIFHPATFMQKIIFDVIGGFDIHFKIAADLDFFLRVPSELRFFYLNETLTNFALGGISTKNPLEVPFEIRRILMKNKYQYFSTQLIFLIEMLRNIRAILIRKKN